MKEKYFDIQNIGKVTSQIIEGIKNITPREKKWEPAGRTALLVADMQNFFLYEKSHAHIPSGEAIIPNINRLIKAFDQKGATVIFSRHFNNRESAGMMGKWWNDLLQRNTPLFEIYNKLEVPDSALIIDKQHYDAFFDTGLEEYLMRMDVSSLVITGVMTNLCCETTLRTAFIRGFETVIPVDATAAYNREFHTSTFLNLSLGFAPLATTGEVIEKLNYDP